MEKQLFLIHAKNRGADQPAHVRWLISASVFSFPGILKS